METVTVYISETGVENPAWVINTHEDEASNFADLTRDGLAQGSLTEYLRSLNRREMPAHLLSDSEAAQAWATSELAFE